MKSLNEIKNEVAIKYGFDSYDDFRIKINKNPKGYKKYFEGMSDNIAILYTHQAIEKAGQIAHSYESEPPFGITRNAILNIKNILF